MEPTLSARKHKVGSPIAWHGVAATAASFTVLLAYLLTLPPTVTGEDSGELISAAYVLGIPHLPGYPLWTLLTHAFTYIHIGSVAYRVALFSAVCGAATASRRSSYKG